MPYRRYLLASLRAGLSAIAMVVMATAMTACSNSQADAPPPPPPEVDAAQVVTKSVRQWDEFTGRFEAVEEVQARASADISTASPSRRATWSRRATFCS